MTFVISDFGNNFMSIVLEAMPFIVFGAVISGALEELLPQQFFSRWLPRSRTAAIIGSSLLGLVMPVCECGIVPVMRRLLKKGVPASCAIAYMLSAPGLNFLVLWSTAMAFWYPEFSLFGVPGLVMVLLRGGLAFITAVTVALVIERSARRGLPMLREGAARVRLVESDESLRLLEEEPAPPEIVPGAGAAAPHAEQGDAPGSAEHRARRPRSLLDRLTAIADIAVGDFVDIAAFLVIGASLAAAVTTALDREQISQLGEHQIPAILAMMGLAMVLSLCSEADAFVAANFSGLAVAAKLAFLVVGPMLDVKLFIMYRWVFSPRVVWIMIGTLCTTIFVLTNCVGLLESVWPSSSPGTMAGGG